MQQTLALTFNNEYQVRCLALRVEAPKQRRLKLRASWRGGQWEGCLSSAD